MWDDEINQTSPRLPHGFTFYAEPYTGNQGKYDISNPATSQIVVDGMPQDATTQLLATMPGAPMAPGAMPQAGPMSQGITSFLKQLLQYPQASQGAGMGSYGAGMGPAPQVQSPKALNPIATGEGNTARNVGTSAANMLPYIMMLLGMSNGGGAAEAGAEAGAGAEAKAPIPQYGEPDPSVALNAQLQNARQKWAFAKTTGDRMKAVEEIRDTQDKLYDLQGKKLDPVKERSPEEIEQQKTRKMGQPRSDAPPEIQWPDAYKNAPKTLSSQGSGGANYTAADLAALKAKLGIQ